MAFTGTLIKNGGVLGYNTAFADGDAPVPAANSIAIVGTVAHGNVITIIAGDDISFGEDAPDFLMNIDMQNASAAGTNFEVTEGGTVNSGYICSTPCHYTTGAVKLPIKSVSGLGHGKGIAVGDLQANLAIKAGSTVGGDPDFTLFPVSYGQIETIVSRKSEELFITYTNVWPAAEQENIMQNSVKNEQCKQIWHYNGYDGHGGLDGFGGYALNLFFGLPSGNGGGKLLTQAYSITNSTTVVVTIAANAVSNYITSSNIGATVVLSDLSSVGNAGNAVIAAVAGTAVTLTVSGWPASGSGTLSILKYGTMYGARMASANHQGFIAQTDYFQLNNGGTTANAYLIDSTHQIANPLIYQTHVICRPSGSSVWTRIIDTTVGEIYNYTESHPYVPELNPARNTFEYMHFPGNVQGVNVNPIAGNPNMSVGKASYFGDLFQQYKNSLRVEITDTSDNGSSTRKLTQLRILSVSDKMITAIVYSGIYASDSLSGQYLHVMTGATTKIASKQI